MNGYSYLTFYQSREIERLHNAGTRTVDIAAHLERSAVAVYGKLKRDYTGERNKNKQMKYSAERVHTVFQDNIAQRGNRRVATVILAREHNEPMNEAVYCEAMFNDENSGEVPEQRQFIYETANPICESWGIKITILRSEKTYVSDFKHVIKKGDQAGKIRVFPLCGRCTIQRDCRLPPINKYKRQLGDDVIKYLGIL